MSFVGSELERIVAIIRCVKIEENATDVAHAVHMIAERTDIVLVAGVDGAVDEERSMRGIPDVSHDPVERRPAKGVVGAPKPIDTDEHGIGRRAKGKRAIGIDDDGQVPEAVGVVDDVVKPVGPVLPEERFPAFQVEATAAFTVEGVDRGLHFPETKVLWTARRHVAVLTPQVAAVGENEPADEGHVLPQKVVANKII